MSKQVNQTQRLNQQIGDLTSRIDQLVASQPDKKPSDVLKQAVKKAVKRKVKALGKSSLKSGLGVARRFIGMGDYQVSNGVAFNSLVRGASVPSVVGSGTPLTIRQSEYLGDVAGSSTFSMQTFALNPGVFTPWLKNIARLYDQWSPLGMVFEIRTTSSDYSAAVVLGTIVAAVEYDPLDPLYANKIDMEQAEGAISFKPSVTAFCGVECDPRLRPTQLLYTRLDAPPSGSDIRPYDLGRFCVATQGQAGDAIGASLAEVWVHYDVTFFKKANKVDFDPDVIRKEIVIMSHGTFSAEAHLFQPSAPANTVYVSGGLTLTSVDTDSITVAGATIGRWYRVEIQYYGSYGGEKASVTTPWTSFGTQPTFTTTGCELPTSTGFLVPAGWIWDGPGYPDSAGSIYNTDYNILGTFAVIATATEFTITGDGSAPTNVSDTKVIVTEMAPPLYLPG